MDFFTDVSLQMQTGHLILWSVSATQTCYEWWTGKAAVAASQNYQQDCAHNLSFHQASKF